MLLHIILIVTTIIPIYLGKIFNVSHGQLTLHKDEISGVSLAIQVEKLSFRREETIEKSVSRNTITLSSTSWCLINF